MKFGHLILRKIIKFVVSRCQIFRLKCAPKSTLAGAPPQTPLGSIQRSPDPLAGFKEPTSKERKGEGREGKADGMEEREVGRDGRPGPSRIGKMKRWQP